jgi:ketosteroid isomerase-like protein
MKIIGLLCLMLCLCLVAACGQNTLPRQTVQSFETAFNRDDVDACLALFTDDAQILPQHGPVVAGKQEIGKFLQEQMTPVASFNTEPDLSLVRGDMAIEQGHYRVRNVRRGADIEEGKYLHIWRNVGGDWKIYRIMYNTDVAPAANVSVAVAEEDEKS